MNSSSEKYTDLNEITEVMYTKINHKDNSIISIAENDKDGWCFIQALTAGDSIALYCNYYGGGNAIIFDLDDKANNITDKDDVEGSLLNQNALKKALYICLKDYIENYLCCDINKIYVDFNQFDTGRMEMPVSELEPDIDI